MNTEIIISIFTSPDSPNVISVSIIGSGTDSSIPVSDPTEIIIGDGLPQGIFSLIIVFDAPQLTPFTVTIVCSTSMPTLSPTFIARMFIYIFWQY